jgi:hypothetical protein
LLGVPIATSAAALGVHAPQGASRAAEPAVR